jgi:hypothetical protein
MFRFTIFDLMGVTLVCAVGIGTIVFAHRTFSVPIVVLLAAAWVIPCFAAGALAGQVRGAFVGMGVGFSLSLVTLAGYGAYLLLSGA